MQNYMHIDVKYILQFNVKYLMFSSFCKRCWRLAWLW